MRRTFAGCWPSAIAVIANSITVPRIDSTAAFFIVRLISSVVYHDERGKEKCNLRLKAARFHHWGKTQSCVRLNCTTPQPNLPFGDDDSQIAAALRTRSADIWPSGLIITLSRQAMPNSPSRVVHVASPAGNKMHVAMIYCLACADAVVHPYVKSVY